MSTLALFTEPGAVPVPIPSPSALRISCAIDRIDGAGNLRRTVNGALLDLSNPLFHKHRVSISFSDRWAPVFSALMPGQAVTLHSPHPFRERVVGGAATLSRDPVPGSVVALSASGAPIAASVAGRVVTAASAAHVAYRPILSCRVVSVSEASVEGALEGSGDLVLEEV